MPIGRAMISGVGTSPHCGTCHASDLNITIRPNGTIFETGMGIENAESVIIAEYWGKYDLIEAYPACPPGSWVITCNPERCENCQSFSKQWYNKNKKRLTASVSELLEDCRQLA